MFEVAWEEFNRKGEIVSKRRTTNQTLGRFIEALSEKDSFYRLLAVRDLDKKPETEEEKRQRMFNFYKQDLVKLHQQCKQLRMNVIEYVCEAPKIDPVDMARTLVKEGYTILFDDSSISARENERKHREVYKA